jgi:geranylgeranyl diphosphate synthase type I
MAIRIKQDLKQFQSTFQKPLEQYLRMQIDQAGVKTIDAKKLMRTVRSFALRPGKRMRPYLAICTARTYGVHRFKADKLGIALELFHDFALIHDDIMDKSDERRGRKTVHVIFGDEHERKGWKGSKEHYGLSNAILAGDLLFTWANRALYGCTTDESIQKKVNLAWSAMQEEVILGQTLDVTAAVLTHGISRKQLLDVLALKSGRYSIGRPILLGYTLAGAHVPERTVLDATEPLGLAFQIQDDLLSTFGNPKKTGKDINSDLREGKLTILAWETMRRIQGGVTYKRWEAAFGNPKATKKDIDFLRKLINESGAYTYVKTLSSQLIERSIERAHKLPRISDWFIELAHTLEERTT